jgi:hypothetical protein
MVVHRPSFERHIIGMMSIEEAARYLHITKKTLNIRLQRLNMAKTDDPLDKRRSLLTSAQVNKLARSYDRSHGKQHAGEEVSSFPRSKGGDVKRDAHLSRVVQGASMSQGVEFLDRLQSSLDHLIDLCVRQALVLADLVESLPSSASTNAARREKIETIKRVRAELIESLRSARSESQLIQSKMQGAPEWEERIATLQKSYDRIQELIDTVGKMPIEKLAMGNEPETSEAN